MIDWLLDDDRSIDSFIHSFHIFAWIWDVAIKQIKFDIVNTDADADVDASIIILVENVL